MNIGYIYYSFYPITGGASVHGYYLARGLSRLGYNLFKINGEPDPHTTRLKNPYTGIFRILRECDVIYVRMDYFFNLRNLVTIVAKLMGKKVIVELNSPSDELHMFGKSRKYILRADRVMGKILRRVDAVIVINDIVKRYCEETMGLENVIAIDNGGEVIERSKIEVSDQVRSIFEQVRRDFSKIVVWTGSANHLHDFEKLKKIASAVDDDVAVILIVRRENQEVPDSELPNLYILENLDRDDVAWVVSGSDIGLTFYSSFDWSRWGYYGSSTKTFEYLNNGLLTIANVKGTEAQRRYPNYRYIEEFDEIIDAIHSFVKEDDAHLPFIRTWDDVARETSGVIQKVVKG